jgi:FkbM family methyltransferase
MMKKIIKFFKPIVEKFPIISNYYRHRRDMNFLKSNPDYIESLGFNFTGPVSMINGNFEIEENKIIQKLLPNIDVVINIGANVGFYCLQAIKQGKRVIAFEPNRLNVDILLKNVKFNGWEECIEIFPLALSDKPGILPMYGASTGASLIKGWAGQTNSVMVPINTMDNIFGDRFINDKCLVIIDIEGAEYSCLKGASFLLKNEQCIFFIEISVGEHQPKGVTINQNLESTFRLFYDEGYKCCIANSDLREVKIQEIQEIQSTGIDTLGVHNFIFYNQNKVITSIVN